MRVMIVSKYDPTSAQNWSGTPHFIFSQIEKMSDEVSICTPTSMSWFRLLARIIRRFAKLFGNSSIDLVRTKFYSKLIGIEVAKKIAEVKPDVVVGIAASIELAFVKTDVPIIHLSDATYASMLNYYPEFTGLWRWLVVQGNAIEQGVIENSSTIICSSHWASTSVVHDYNAPLDKVHTILLGANVKKLPVQSETDIEQKFSGVCRLLFVGKEWERKGGDIVLGVYKRLVEAGIETQLTIIGCRGKEIPDDPNITIYENINKDKADHMELFNALFGRASFFIVPSQAEAFGLVYAEAAAYGTPAVGSMTGGIPSIVIDNITGVLLPENATSDDYAKRVIELWRDKDKLRKMSQAAKSRFNNDLSWERWSEEFSAVAKQVIGVERQA